MFSYCFTGCLCCFVIIVISSTAGQATSDARQFSNVYYRNTTGRSKGFRFEEEEEQSRWPNLPFQSAHNSKRPGGLMNDSSWRFWPDHNIANEKRYFNAYGERDIRATWSNSDSKPYVKLENDKKYLIDFKPEGRSTSSSESSEEVVPDAKSKRDYEFSFYANNDSSTTSDEVERFKPKSELQFPKYNVATRPYNFEFPSSEEVLEERGRYLSTDTIDTISETLGAINTVGRYLVNYTRGDRRPAPGDRLDIPPARYNEDVPGAILTISKNVLGRNVTDSIAPLVRVLPIGSGSGLQPQQVRGRVCTTPGGKSGYCEDLSNCPQLLLDLGNLRQSICFKSLFVPGVCCPIEVIGNTGNTLQEVSTTKRPAIQSSNIPIQNAPSLDSLSTTSTYRPNEVYNSFASGDCGQQEAPKFRVVGGEEALPGRWPWMAAIFLHGSRRTEFWCGGSLIGSRYILTAAHCTKDTRQRPFQARQFTVRLGDIDLRREDEPSSPQTYHVSEVRAHPRFSRVGFYNDIAVLVLERSVKRSRYVIPVCLPPNTYRTDQFIGEQPTVIGWGTTYYGGKESTVQRQVALPVWKNEDCDRTYFQPINENFICAGVKEGGKDACQGDSGGPLILKKNGRWMQIGIVSFGNKCGEPGYPGVYTRVTRYLDWISSNTNH